MTRQDIDDDDSVEQDGKETRYTHREAASLGEDVFEDSSVDRRTFLRVAAVTGAALSLPSTAAGQETVEGDVTDDSMTDLAEFVVNSTPVEYEAALAIDFVDSGSLDAFYNEYGEPDWDIDDDNRAPKVVTRDAPGPSAHAHITAQELEFALDEIDGVCV